MLRKIDPQRLVQGIVKVASLPSIYLKIEKAIADEKTSNNDLADIVAEDTALAAKLLRLANSAMFSFPSKISAIPQAVTIIGSRQLRDLVLACSVTSVFKDMPAQLVDMESFWRHSVASAVTARILSQTRNDSNIESAFVAGLLHDIGRLILFKEFGSRMRDCIESAVQRKINVDAMERELFGCDHAQIGALLLKEWKLPSLLVATTQYHHVPTRSQSYSLEAAYVHIANIIVSMLKMGHSGDIRIPKLDHAAWSQLGIHYDIIDNIVEQVETQYLSAVEFVLGEAA